MLPAPNHNARLRPGDRLWVDLTLSSEESDHSDDAARNNKRRRKVARADNNNGQQQRALPPRVDINPYAPPNWNPNPVPPPSEPPPRGSPSNSIPTGTKSESPRLAGTDPGTTATLCRPCCRKSKSGQYKRKHPSVGPGHGATGTSADPGGSHHPTATYTQEVGQSSLYEK